MGIQVYKLPCKQPCYCMLAMPLLWTAIVYHWQGHCQLLHLNLGTPVANELEKLNLSVAQVRALRRGIGVHHSGLPTKYRQSVEVLFRAGHLRVVIATGRSCSQKKYSTQDDACLSVLTYNQFAPIKPSNPKQLACMLNNCAPEAMLSRCAWSSNFVQMQDLGQQMRR